MERTFEQMWAQKLGLASFEPSILKDLLGLMVQTGVDYTIFFRELSRIPDELSALQRSFYEGTSEALDARWRDWLGRWRERIVDRGDVQAISQGMKRVNPSVTWREWLVAPAYKEAERGDVRLVHELQEVFKRPYEEPTPEVAGTYDRLKPSEFFNAGGVSHYSCSS